MFVDTYVLVAVGVAEATCGSVFDKYFSVVAAVVDVCIGPCCGRSRSGQPFLDADRCEKRRSRRAEKQRKRPLDVSTCFIFLRGCRARSHARLLGVLMRKFGRRANLIGQGKPPRSRISFLVCLRVMAGVLARGSYERRDKHA